MRRVFLLFLLAVPAAVFGQFKITGKILDSADKKPIPGATVLLGNASTATATAVDGTFTLDNVRGGQYDLVVSMVGYAIYRKTVLVNDNITLPEIYISSKSISLSEVKITPDPDWARHYEDFRREFLGSSDYAGKCRILNPEVINIHYDKATRVLSAGSSDFIVIENKALGYKVKYQLSDFTKEYNTGVVYYAGESFFENLKGKESQQRTWEKNRLKVYKGSSMNFLRAISANQVAEQGFGVRRLIRTPDTGSRNILNRQYFEKLVTNPPLTIVDFVKLTDRKGLYALTFNDCLYVMYSPKHLKPKEDMMDASPVSTTIIFDKSYALFDNNGIFIDPSSITFEGAWGRSRMAEMLPIDYVPTAEK